MTTPVDGGDTRILIVDDDAPTRTLLRRLLTMEGYDVFEAPDGPSAMRKAATVDPDLMLVDIMMPGQDGLDLMATLRRTSDVPIILLTAKGDEGDRVVGLRLGADDYVVKPFSTAELTARIASVLRRAGGTSGAGGTIGAGSAGNAGGAGGTGGTGGGHTRSRLDYGALQVDLASRAVTVDGRLIELPGREYELLVFLASSPRQVFSRHELLEHVWRSSADRQDPATVTEHIRRLRLRIETDPENPHWVHTVRGIGYRFEG